MKMKMKRKNTVEMKNFKSKQKSFKEDGIDKFVGKWS